MCRVIEMITFIIYNNILLAGGLVVFHCILWLSFAGFACETNFENNYSFAQQLEGQYSTGDVLSIFAIKYTLVHLGYAL